MLCLTRAGNRRRRREKSDAQRRTLKTDIQRFEAKYLISEVAATALQSAIDPYVMPDPHGQHYPVSSLYLDSPDLRLYWSSQYGETNRFKLRLRCYTENDDGEAPVFFEVKRRIDRVVKKHRCPVLNRDAADILDGHTFTSDGLAATNGRGAGDLLYFRQHMEHLGASPRAMVRYDREAYVSRGGDPVRVTFDRRLRCLPCLSYATDVWAQRAGWRPIAHMPVILEIKFTDVLPPWTQRVIQQFHLLRESVCKYVLCVDAAQETGTVVSGRMDGAVL